MTREERLELLKQIEKDIHVNSLESTLLDDAKSCAIHSVIEELEQEITPDKPHIKGDYYDGFNNALRTVAWRYDKLRNELIQAIQNGVIKIESGNEELFRIIDKYKESEENKCPQ